MAYREAPPAPGLPFPRKNLGGFTAVTVVVGACAFVIPSLFFLSPEGFRMFREGGWAIYMLIFSGIVSAGALAVLSAFVARGKAVPAALVAGLPAVTAVLGSLLAALFGHRMLSAVGGPIDPSQTMRILAEGTGELDSIYFFACLFSAASFGAASVAHLAAASTVDRSRSGAPSGSAWLASLALGVLGVFVGVGLRLALRVSAGVVFLAIPSLVVVTTFACIASRNAVLARGWHDPREAGAWVTSILVAAITAAAGVFLIDLAAALLCEKRALHAISGASIDTSQQVRILVDGLAEKRGALLCAGVDSLFAFAIPAATLAVALGRGTDGRSRSPLGAPSLIAAGAVALVVVAVFGTRASTFSAVSKTEASTPSKPEVDLPLLARTAQFEPGRPTGSILTVRADGTSKPPSISAYSSNIVLVADRRAKWADVARALRTTMAQRNEALFARSSPTSTTLSIRVQTNEEVDRSSLGSYAVFLGPDEATIEVLLEPAFDAGPMRRVKPGLDQDMDAVLAAIAAAGPTGGRTLLLPPEGRW